MRWAVAWAAGLLPTRHAGCCRSHRHLCVLQCCAKHSGRGFTNRPNPCLSPMPLHPCAAPNVLVWSAVACSSAFPFLFAAMASSCCRLPLLPRAACCRCRRMLPAACLSLLLPPSVRAAARRTPTAPAAAAAAHCSVRAPRLLALAGLAGQGCKWRHRQVFRCPPC